MSTTVNWSLLELRGKPVTLEIVDHSIENWGFIAVRGFKIIHDETASDDPGESKP